VGGGGVAVLEQWVQRRSDDDVTAFRKWFNEMYQRDPGVGMKMLDWKMPSMWDLPDQNGSPPAVPPTEWTRLKQPEPGAAGGFGDEDEELVGQGKLRGAESVVRRLLQQRTGVNGETIKLAEFCLTMSVVSACLIFGPSFVAQWVQRGPELDPSVSRSQTLLPSGIGGVDAYLIQTDFDRDRVEMPSGRSDGQTQTPEIRSQIKAMIRQGKTDEQILKMQLPASADDLAKMRDDVTKEKASAAAQMPSINWRRFLQAPRYSPDA